MYKKINYYLVNQEILKIINLILSNAIIKKEFLHNIIEESLEIIARKQYGRNMFVDIQINFSSNDILFYKELIVTNKINFNKNNISIKKIEKKIYCISLGDIYKKLIPNINLTRYHIILLKKIVTNRIEIIEKRKLYNNFKSKIGKIVYGIIEKIKHNMYIVKINNFEAILRKNQLLKTEFFRLKDRIKACLISINEDELIMTLSRSNKDFVKQLFLKEIPEIYENTIEIKSISRDAGYKSKISIHSKDQSIDLIKSCIGFKGIRIKSIIKELKGEKIDIIIWHKYPAIYSINSLSEVKINKIVIDSNNTKINIFISDEYKNKAIGHKGQNVKLISELIKWNINIITNSYKLSFEVNSVLLCCNMFIKHLYLDNILAKYLIIKGFTSIKSLSKINISILSKIEGLNNTVACKIIDRSKEYIKNNI